MAVLRGVNTDDLGERLLKIKRKLEKEKERKSQLQGELKSIMGQLEDEFKVSSIEQAEELLAEYKEKLQKMKDSLHRKIEQLEEEIGDVWDE